MPDPILEEIWRVREQLIKRHGGIDGYFQYVQTLERARRQRARRQRARRQRGKKTRTQSVKSRR